MILSLIAALALQQTPVVEPVPVTADTAAVAANAVKTNEERTADALEKAANAADRLAAAAERMSPPPAPAAPGSPAPVSDPWDVSVGANATWLSGNVNSVTFAGSASVIRKTRRTIFTAKLFGGYGETYNAESADGLTPASTDVLLFNAGAAAQFDLRFGDYITIFVGGGLDTDHVKSVEIRGYGDLGVGAVWLDKKEGDLQKLYLKTDLSIRVQPEVRQQYYPTGENLDDAMFVGPRIAATFRYSFTKTTFFTEDIELLPNVLGSPRVLINNATKLGVGIVGAFSVTAGFAVKYDSAPAENRKQTDTQLLIGVEANF